MLTRIFTLLLILFYTHAVQATPQNYVFTPQVQQIKIHFQNQLDAVYPQENATKSSTADPVLIKLLKENDEEKLTQYFDQLKTDTFQNLSKIARQGDLTASVAQLEFALFLGNTDFLKQINLTAIQQLSDQNDAYATTLLAIVAKRTDEYIPLLEKAGEQGSSFAQMTLADEYGFRLPIEQQDPEKAKYWANKAKQSLGEDRYIEEKCALANCDTESFEMVDFSKLIEDEPADSPARAAYEAVQKINQAEEEQRSKK